MWVYENLEFIIGGVFVAGLGGHFAARWRHRRGYATLRRAYENAVREVRDTGGDPAALVRGQELHREFMRACLPGWFDGFGHRLRMMAKLCAGLTLLAFLLKGPIEHGEATAARKAQARAAAANATAKGTRASAAATRR
jgi:hypothetical protein